ncbi:hypothetical protein [Thalassomonas actiniarum]|uniref:Uncharacterized protein n=1 Tax=Thalassomonas actiniarum TaxID=485447 RepID=A0AAE9YM97_9GAMM|nr:hypothetical protein [Thalassomonas actiniarum]WDD97527.1 hypothetical protein SG35_019705 [Thalassomonas actiniarum]
MPAKVYLKKSKRESTDKPGAVPKCKHTHLHLSEQVVNSELTGFRVINGILEHYRPLLELNEKNFKMPLQGKRNGDGNSNLDLAIRLASKLPSNYIHLYEKSLSRSHTNIGLFGLEGESWEWL